MDFEIAGHRIITSQIQTTFPPSQKVPRAPFCEVFRRSSKLVLTLLRYNEKGRKPPSTQSETIEIRYFLIIQFIGTS